MHSTAANARFRDGRRASRGPGSIAHVRAIQVEDLPVPTFQQFGEANLAPGRCPVNGTLVPRTGVAGAIAWPGHDFISQRRSSRYPERVNPPLGLRQALSPLAALAEQGFNR